MTSLSILADDSFIKNPDELRDIIKRRLDEAIAKI
jgi:hypothetical protein